ncbi:MAG TPA: oligosaccharide flippase family protein [Sedimentibacter sp.]|nr:oligosaccharide flippase family protein [Sedimentibacter sp.]
MTNKNEFERSSLNLFALMMLANACNYIFQIVMGNMLTVEEFGSMNTLLSLFTIFSVPTTIITLISARYIAIFDTTHNKEGLYKTLKFLIALTAGIMLLVLLGGISLSGVLTSSLKLNNQFYIIAVVILASVGFLRSIANGVLQGTKKFVPYGIQNFLVMIGKLIFSCLFVWMGYRLYGILTAMGLAMVLSFCYAIFYIRDYLTEMSHSNTTAYQLEYKDMFRFIAGTVCAQCCIELISNSDMLLVKRYFTETEAGTYSSAMVIGKIAMYLSTAIITALFPLVVEAKAKNKATTRLLGKAIAYGGGAALVCSAGLSIFGKLIINLLFGERYSSAINMLPWVSLFIVPLTLVVIVMNYTVALGKTFVFAASSFTGVALIYLLVIQFHSSIRNVMIIFSVVLSIVFIINMIYLLLCNRKLEEI